MASSVAIELRNISKYFGNNAANKDINLSVNHGEILAIWEKTEVVKPPL